MARLTRSPRFWLAMLMLSALGCAWAGGLLVVAEANDSRVYIEASRVPLREMLGKSCTVAYPLVLKAVGALPHGLVWVPWVHLAAHFLAVGFFYAALGRFGAPPWHALAASAGFLATMFGDRALGLVLTDFLGRDMAVVTVGCLFWLAAAPRSILAWGGLIFAAACCYQLRPAYLFLLPLAPCLGLVLLRIRTGRDRQPFRWKGFALASCCASLVPYVGFCLLRLAVVGHFGLVSFGGVNMVGVTAEMLDARLADSLPETLRPLAQEILRQRDAMAMTSPLDGAGIDMGHWAKNYNRNVWQVAVPAAQRLYGNDPVAVNRQLTALSQAVIRARKGVYLRFLTYNFRCGLGKLLDSGWLIQALAAASLGAFGLRAWLCRQPTPANHPQGAPAARAVWDALLLAAAGFGLAKLALVALVEMMVPRYVFAAGVLLPSVLALAVWRQLEGLGAIAPRKSGAAEGRPAPGAVRMHVPRKTSSPV